MKFSAPEKNMKAFTEEIIAFLFSLINEKGSLIKSASLNGKEAKEASFWMSLHDGSGYLKQFVKEEAANQFSIRL